MTDVSKRLVAFGVYEVDLASGELRRQGRLVRLQQQPFEVLRALVERPGDLVTRDELQRRLWPDGVTVEFETALNKSVAKLRDALGDVADNPRFIETLPKRGYRFIAPVRSGSAPVDTGASPTPAAPADPPAAAAGTAAARNPGWRRRRAVLAAAAVAALTVAAGLWLGGRPPAPAEAARERPGLSPIFAARDAYERGQVAMARRSEDGLRSSVTQFARAVALSPHYAEAYVGLADALSLLSSYGLVDPREAMPRARDAANRALAIDPSLAQAHASLGRTAMIFDWDWRTAEFHLAKARALAPGDGRVHQWSAYLLAALGRFEEAEAEARRAVAAEPLSPNTNTALGFVLYLTRQFEAAEIQLRRTIEMDPDFLQARRALALVAVQTRRLPEATAELERVARVNRESPAARADLAWIYGLSGRQDEARRLIAELEQTASRSFVPPDGLAQASLGIGDIDAALSWIDRALATRVATLANLAVDPMWDPMRGQPRFAAALETIGRPSRQAER